MAVHAQAGQKVNPRDLENIPRLMAQYYALRPEVSDINQMVSFGTSGHRGVSSEGSFNEAHILAISQAVAEYRSKHGIGGPLYLGMDSHALSEAAFLTALEVLCANGVKVLIQSGLGYTPTPVISHAILSHNADLAPDAPQSADGIVITPSHNPPQYGGFKYNPPTGGPADATATKWIEQRANALLRENNAGVKRVLLDSALRHPLIEQKDLVLPYVEGLTKIIDMAAISASGLRLGVNPLGGATMDFWFRIASHYKLDLTVTQPYFDPTFGFMTCDHDGKIRMDCSSPYAMASMIDLKDSFDLSFGNDPDGDRHGIVTRTGLMNPNHYLAVMIEYLYSTRSMWGKDMMVGKTLVSSALIDRVAKGLGRRVYEVPVGFKWFVDGLFGKWLGFGGEESAGASFLCLDNSVWSTDKDGIIPCLLAAEMTAKTGLAPDARHQAQVERYGSSSYGRVEAPADARVRKLLGALSAESIHLDELAGEKIDQVLTHAPGNGAAIGGLKVTAPSGWFAVRPSGTEDIYKIYAESFLGTSHLEQIQLQAQEIVRHVTAV